MKEEIMQQEESCRRFVARRTMSMMLALLLVLSLGVTASATDGVSVVTAQDWSSVMTALTNQISVATVVAVLAVIVGACVGLVFMWWGVRKATRALMTAFKKGKISI